MPKERDPKRAEAEKLWLSSEGQTDLVVIAAQLGLSAGTVRGWKSKDKWGLKLNGTFQSNERSVPKDIDSSRRKKARGKPPPIIETIVEELTEKQRLFCIYYIKTFNATMSAIKAGYAPDSAHAEGSRQLKNVKVAEYIRSIKTDVASAIFVEVADIINKYIRIAFADITDYAKFGRRDVQVMGMHGPVFEGKGKNKKPIMKTINYVDFSESTHIDGTVIAEVKQGKDGVSIKLHDKMRALKELEKYLDFMTAEQKLQIKKLQLEVDSLERASGVNDDNVKRHVGAYIDALNGTAGEVWNDEEEA